MPDFIPSGPVLAAYAAASVILALTPGPDMTFFLSKTVAQSRAAGIAAFFGAWTGIVVHSCLVALGLSALLLASTVAFSLLKIVGAVYLAWLAFDAIRHGSSLTLKPGAGSDSLRSVYLKGLLVDLLNPKVIIFFLTFLPQFVSAEDANVPGKLLFLGLTFAVVSIPASLPLIFFAERIAGWLKRSARATRGVDWLFAGVFSAFAVKLVLTGSR